MTMPRLEQKKRYVKLTYEGSSCIVEANKVADQLCYEDRPQDFEREDVWMSPAQFRALPEFMGW
jgi:hypothetical protein